MGSTQMGLTQQTMMNAKCELYTPRIDAFFVRQKQVPRVVPCKHVVKPGSSGSPRPWSKEAHRMPASCIECTKQQGACSCGRQTGRQTSLPCASGPMQISDSINRRPEAQPFPVLASASAVFARIRSTALHYARKVPSSGSIIAARARKLDGD
jgi:hypothetical protein